MQELLKTRSSTKKGKGVPQNNTRNQTAKDHFVDIVVAVADDIRLDNQEDEITNHEDYERFKKLGLPVDEFLKHGSISIYPPGFPHRYVARNRRGERFHMRQTMDDEDYKRFHMEKMPKMINWHPEETNFE